MEDYQEYPLPYRRIIRNCIAKSDISIMHQGVPSIPFCEVSRLQHRGPADDHLFTKSSETGLG